MSVRALSMLLLVSGCAGPASSHMIDESQNGQRPLCGWEALSKSSGVVELTSVDSNASVAPGSTVTTLVIADDVPFSAVERALAPARDDLVRIKVAYERRWLVPLTNPSRQPPKPAPTERVETIVGHRRITRSKTQPRARIADVRVDGSRLRLFVENERPRGVELSVSELEAALRKTQPPVETFTLTASDATRWSHLAAAIRAAACYDRVPGEEPHEVILD